MIVAGSASPLLLSSAGGYNLTNSLRFRSSAGAYLNRTPASAGNQKTWTYSTWIKRGAVSAEGTIISGGATTGRLCVFFNSSGNLVSDVGGTGTFDQSVAVYRDPSAWYHFVWQFDTTQATAANRSRMYINGSQISLTQTRTFALNTDYQINNSVLQTLGTFSNSIGTYNFDGYQAETNFIDGQALTPSSFGETSTSTGVWIPKKYTGTYGTNGFYLPFTDNSSLTTSSNVGLGKDFSGNANYWVTNNISITAGSTYDSMTDVPTLTSATAANYCVMNPLRIQNVNIGAGTLSDGNLKITTSASDDAYSNHYGTMAFPTTGKWYFEAVFAGAFGNDAGNYAGITGVSNGSAACTIVVTSTTAIQKNFSNVQTGLSFATGNILGVAFDATNLTVDFYKNGSAFGSQVTGLDSVEYTPFILASNPASTQSSWTLNFGQRPFAYTPPSGFVTLNTRNLPTPTIGATASTTANKYFNATTYTGNGTSQSITNSGSMQPDWVWLKCRSTNYRNQLYDSVRGATKALFSDSTDAEGTYQGVTAFNSNGFSLGTELGANASGDTFVGWQWRASNTTAVTNTQGSINSSVSANTTAGFSIVTYTGNGTSGATVGHGLGVAPSMVILKQRDGASSWQVKHVSLNANQNLILNSTAAVDTAPGSGYISAISSTTLTLLNGGSAITNVNANNGTYVAYCFAQVAGYSAFGSYTGNGSSDGPFVFTGFRPRFFMTKCSSSTGDWHMTDTARYPTNSSTSMGYLDANTSAAEGNFNIYDGLSNGFKVRDNGSVVNASGATYIYMAFAENPFKYANAR
jgi:hypothetical protein